MRLLIALLAFGFAGCRTVQPGLGESSVKFFGADSRRAEMTFETTLYYTLPEGFDGDATAVYSSDLKDDIDEQIEAQLSHMFSAFVNHTKPYDFSANPGIPRERPDIKVKSSEQVAGHHAVNIHYSYKDIVVFKKSMFHGSDKVEVPILLPKEPKVIYGKGLVSFAEAKQIFAGDTDALDDFKVLKAEGETHVNLCTDHHYNTEGDYWYFWNPYQKGCPHATKDATIEVDATMRPLNSTANSFPRYDTLFGDNGNGDETRVTFLVGIDENWKKADLGRQGFEKTFRMLTEGKRLLDSQTGNADTDLLLPAEVTLMKAIPDAEDVNYQILTNEARHKTLRLVGGGHKVLVNMYLVKPDSGEFVTAAVKGLREADVFIYDGHSGLGGYLSVGRLFEKRRQTLPKDKYQIYFFNGCSTFSYYNYDYFQLKATEEDPEGRKNLDIVTTATPAAFSSGPATDYWLIRSLTSGSRQSWQKIMTDVVAIAGDESALVHVNGDEDNPHGPHE